LHNTILQNDSCTCEYYLKHTSWGITLYLVVSFSAVSSTLVREDSRVQKPVYFTSKALHRAEERYPWIKKKIGLCTGYLSMEAKTVFPSSFYSGVDRISHEESAAEARSLGKACELGDRALAVRH